jgi:uncharacterized protein (TIGR03437 family)
MSLAVPFSNFRRCLVPLLAIASAAAQNVTVTVSNQQDTTSGIDGRLNMFVSTAFQPADWDYQFFTMNPGAAALLWERAPQHINMQPLAGAIPQTGANTWDFTENNAVVQPLLGLSDHSPLYQIATAPGFLSNSSGQLPAANIPQFAQYSANLVRYFNTGGFSAGGTHYQSPSPWPIKWWGIFNEPNLNGISAPDYVTLYNTTVPAMQAVDPSIHFVAVELSDFGNEPQMYLPTFVQGVTARVDAVATHYYGSCDQTDTDQDLFGAVPIFAQHVQYIRSQMATNPALATKPLWVTENNVNADYDSNGMSACNPGQVFVSDTRGTSPFFAAWRPLVYLSLAKAGAQSLHHWDYDADVQYGEVDYNTGNTYLSYWVDYYLNHLFPSPPGADILGSSVSDSTQGVDSLAVRNDDGSVLVMVVNSAIANPSTDNNGPGLARTATIDVSALGAFQSANLITIDKTTSAATGPTVTSIPVTPTVQVALNGYSVAFLRLNTTAMAVKTVASAASGKAGAIAPGEIVSVSGTGLGPADGAESQASTPGFLDNFVAGARIYFDEFAAPVLYASAGQVDVAVPWGVQGRKSVMVKAEYMGQFTSPSAVSVQQYAPAIFTLNSSGKGQAAVLNVSGMVPNSTSTPAGRGGVIAIYATGGGVGGNAVDGRVEASESKPNLPVTVSIGGKTTTATYAGDAAGMVSGMLQINAVVPQSVTPGSSVPLTISIGGVTSPSGVTIAVQ